MENPLRGQNRKGKKETVTSAEMRNREHVSNQNGWLLKLASTTKDHGREKFFIFLAK